MPNSNHPSCPKCRSNTSIKRIGKRNALYPSGCFAILSLPFCAFHQLSSPIDYRCESCDRRFGKRGPLEKFGLILFILSVASIPLLFIVAFLALE